MPQSKGGRLFKVLFSIFALYQIFVMCVMPNLGSYLGRSAQKYISPYASAMGLNSGWNFFSPDPAHTMYLRYYVHFEDLNADGDEVKSENEKPMIEGFFPPEKNKSIAGFTRHREAILMRFMILNPKRLQYLMGDWLCRQYPGSTRVDMEHVIETIPSLVESVAFEDQDVRELSKEVQVTKAEYTCSGQNSDEVEFE